MSKNRRERDFLLDIEDAINRILEYTAGMNWDEYLRDYKTQDAVVRNLEVIGEATKNLSDEFRDQHPGYSVARYGWNPRSPDSSLFRDQSGNCLADCPTRFTRSQESDRTN